MPPVNTPSVQRTPPLSTSSGRIRSSQSTYGSIGGTAASSSATLDPLLESESESRRHRRRRGSVSMRRFLEPEFTADLERSIFSNRHIEDEETRRDRLATMEAIARHWHSALHSETRRDSSDISSRHRSAYGSYNNRLSRARPLQRPNPYDPSLATPRSAGVGIGGGDDEDEDILAIVAGALGDESLPRAPSPPLIGSIRSSRLDRERGTGGGGSSSIGGLDGRTSIGFGEGGIGSGTNTGGDGTSSSVFPSTGGLASTLRSNRDSRTYWGHDNPNRWQPWYETDFERYNSSRPDSSGGGGAGAGAGGGSSGGSSHTRSSARPIEEAIKYLTKLQTMPMEDETLQALAIEHFRHDFSVDDFMVDTKFITIPETSWLAGGGQFKGTQFAANSSVSINRRPSVPSHSSFSQLHQSISSAASTYAPTTTSSASSVTHGDDSQSTKKQDDRWTVHVTIHSVDYEAMKLSGTMQAFEVPDWQSATGTSSINTFWEGEIIDFKKHGLETINFSSNPSIDGTYWRKLEPFAGMNDFELAQKLVSKKFLRSLSEKWVLMRWKEKCFVSPSSHESGLTISGFYFVCLRRSDGAIEGFYFDPHSTPYQQLSLTPSQRLFPSYQFR